MVQDYQGSVTPMNWFCLDGIFCDNATNNDVCHNQEEEVVLLYGCSNISVGYSPLKSVTPMSLPGCGGGGGSFNKEKYELVTELPFELFNAKAKIPDGSRTIPVK